MRKTYLPAAVIAVLALAMTFTLAADEKSDGKKAQIGSPAPAFSLQDISGKTVSLSDFDGKTVVLEWLNPDCPFVQRHYNLKTMTTLADKNKDKGVAWIGVATGDTANADKLKSFSEKQGIGYPILLDPDGNVGRAYGAKRTPELFIIKEGKLLYAGGIDDQPNDDPKAPLKEGTVNYVDKALSEIQAGQPVSQAETKAYGCTVKYKK